MSEAFATTPAAFAPPGAPPVPHGDLVVSLFREVLSGSSPAASTGGAGESAESAQPPAAPATPSTTAAPEIPGVSEVALGEPGPRPLEPPPIHARTIQPLEPPAETSAASLPYGEPAGPQPGTSAHERVGTGLPFTHDSYASLPGLVEVVQPEAYRLPGAAHEPFAALASPGSLPPAPTFDVEKIRRDFPALNQRIHGHPLVYLDNAATTQKPQAVIDAVARFYGHDNAPVHRAAYELAERATAAFEDAREKVRQFVGAADRKDIIFTRGTTEGINLVANTYGRKFIGQGDEILLSELEHHANIVPWQLLAAATGAVIKVAPINDRGEIVIEEYARLLGPRTKIVSIAHVSNALGTVNPVELIIGLAHARGVPVLIDAAQSAPHLPVNAAALDADFLVLSGHKIFGPTGIGALYAKSSILETLPPYQGGGHMIRDVRFERTVFQNAPEKFEAGTPNIAGAVGLGAAIDYISGIGLPAIAAYEHALLEYATAQITRVPGLRLIGTAANKASVLSFVISGIENDVIARHLDQRGIAVRSGHHCALPAARHFGLESTVRPSLAFYNTRSDVDVLVHALQTLVRGN